MSEYESNTYSPATGSMEVRMFLLIMKSFRCYVFQGDVPSAYLNGTLEEAVQLFLP